MKKILMVMTILMSYMTTQAQFHLTGVIDQPISCHGNNDASIQLTAWNYNILHHQVDVPGVIFFNTTLQAPFTTQCNKTGFFDHLNPGNYYSCAVLNQDTLCYNFTIMDAEQLDIQFSTLRNPICSDSTGQLSISITGGTNTLQGFLTTWTNVNNPNVPLNDLNNDNFALSLDNLTAGTYNVAIEDDNGCFYNESYILYPKGDINQDQNVDLLDSSTMEYYINNFMYNETCDLNHDNNVDALDLTILENCICQ